MWFAMGPQTHGSSPIGAARPRLSEARSCHTRPVQPRRLLLVRHAKAAQGPVDLDRPLTDKGARRAAAIGEWLEESGLVPDRVLVSPARRAAQTWEQAATMLKTAPTTVVDERIYDNTVEALLEAIREIPEDVRTVALVGHNPSMAEMVAVLDDGQGSPSVHQKLDAGFRTGGVAVFDLAGPFAETETHGVTLTDFAIPGH
jgi:phosphohistidine phosphatase